MASLPAKDGTCSKNFGPSPFQRKDATHILVADFWAHRSAGPDFADSVTEQVDAELRRFREEVLRNPQEFDIEVPEGSLELGRLRCFIQGHEQAREAAKALGADVVVWGKAYCNAPGSAVSAQVQVDIETGDVTAGDASPVSIGNVTVQGGKPYAVCPSATLVRSDMALRQTAQSMDLGSIGDLDLPALASTKPFMLVHFALGLHFYERGSYPLAARFFRKSAADVLATERNTESLDLMLGFVYHYLPDHERSIAHSRRALERIDGRGTMQEAALLNNIGGALQAQGQYAQALEYYRRALAVHEASLGKSHPLVALSLNNIGSALQAKGQYAQAIEYYRRALEIDEKALGEGHPNIATRLNNIGGVLKEQGQYDQATEYYRRALAIRETTLGKDHPAVAIILNNIGSVLEAQDRYAQALEHYRRAVVINVKTLGNDHPSVAIALNNVGHALLAQREYAQALEHFRRALAIDENALGKGHPEVATRLTNIGGVFQEQGQHVQALEYFRRALIINEKALGNDHPNVARDLNNIGTALQAQAEYVQALEYHRRALAIDERAFGKDHPNVAIDLNNVGSALQELGKHDQAIEHYRRALAIFEKALGPGHASTRTVRRNLAIYLAEQSGFVYDADKRGRKIARGVVVLRCLPGCQSLEAGDWLRAYNSISLESVEQLQELVSATPPERAVTLTVVRKGKTQTLPARGGKLGVELY